MLNAFPDLGGIWSDEKENNQKIKYFKKFGSERPSALASLPWNLETTRHKINMAENVMFDVIVKVEHNKKYILPRLLCCEMLLQVITFFLKCQIFGLVRQG